MKAQRKAIIVGAGKIGRHLIKTLPDNWTVSLIDTSEKKLELFEDEGRVTGICGDASSRLVLQKAEPNAATVLFLTTRDDELNKECGKIAKDAFLVEEVVSMLDDVSDLGALLEKDVVDVSKLIALHMSNQAAATFQGVGIGLGKGEIRQITVLSSSPAIGMALKELKPQKWLVAAIFRNKELLVPHGDTTIQSGDRILIVGEPAVLDTEGQYLRGGRLMFPTQYGKHLGHIDLNEECSKEMTWLKDNTLAVDSVRLKKHDFSPRQLDEDRISQVFLSENIGCLVLEPKSVSWFTRFGFSSSSQNKLLLSSRVPVFIPRGSTPIKKILMAVGTNEHAPIVGAIGVDLCRQFEGSLTSLCVINPHSDKIDEEELRKIPEYLSQIARSNGIELKKVIEQGNPIYKIREHAADYDLLILGYSKASRNTIFKPDISMHLLHDAPCSTLFIPWDANRR